MKGWMDVLGGAGGGQMDAAHARFAASLRVQLPAQTAKERKWGSGVMGSSG